MSLRSLLSLTMGCMKKEAHSGRLQDEGEDERQRRIREAALRCAGTIHGGDPNRAESSRSEVRARIA